MITITNENSLVHRIKSILFTLSNRLDNNNIADMDVNGESKFLNGFLNSFDKEVVVFDVGANIGHYSEIIIQICHNKNLNYELHLFEPTASCFTEIKSKFDSNKDVSLNNFGVSDSACSSKIFYDAEKSGFASLYQRDLKSENISLNLSENILLKRLDAYILEKHISKIDLLKIDIEGHEIAAFRGLGKFLTPDFISAIQFEYGGANLDSHTSLNELYTVLQSAGFELYKIMKNGIEQREYTSRMENYQYSNFVAMDRRLLRK